MIVGTRRTAGGNPEKDKTEIGTDLDIRVKTGIDPAGLVSHAVPGNKMVIPLSENDMIDALDYVTPTPTPTPF